MARGIMFGAMAAALFMARTAGGNPSGPVLLERVTEDGSAPFAPLFLALNIVLGVIEGTVVARVSKVSLTRAWCVCTVANVVSAVLGLALTVPPSASVPLLVLGMYGVAMAVETPIVLLGVRSASRDSWRVSGSMVLGNAVTHAATWLIVLVFAPPAA